MTMKCFFDGSEIGPIGGDRDHIRGDPNVCLQSHPLLDDWISLAHRHVLMVLFLCTYVLCLPCAIWYDACGYHSKFPDCYHLYGVFPRILESLLWIRDSRTENPNMVEMELLAFSSGMDHIWTRNIPIGR